MKEFCYWWEIDEQLKYWFYKEISDISLYYIACLNSEYHET